MSMDDYQESSTGSSAEFAGIIEGYQPRIPDRLYEVKYLNWETATQWGGPKVIVHFAIVRPDTYAGIEVPRYYNAKALTGPPKKYGRFKVTFRHDLVRDYCRLIGQPERLDRITLSHYKDHRIRARLETVTEDGKSREIPGPAQYSKIAELIEICD